MSGERQRSAPPDSAIYLRLPVEDYHTLARLADADGLSLAGYGRQVMRRYLHSLKPPAVAQ